MHYPIDNLDRLALRRLAAEAEALRWQRCRSNPLPAGAARGTYAVDWQTRLSNRSLAYRVACAYFMPALRQSRTAAASEAAFTEAGRLPHYTIADLGRRGMAEAYNAPAPIRSGAFDPFGAMALAAVRMLRRWRWLAAADSLPLPVRLLAEDPADSLPLLLAYQAEAAYAPEPRTICQRCQRRSYAAGYGCEAGC